MTAFIIYIAQVLETLNILFCIIGFSYSGGIAVLFVNLTDDLCLAEAFRKINKKHFIVAFIFCLFGALIPGQKTIYLMLGVTYAEDLLKTEEGKKVRLILNKKLDEMIKEIK